MKGYTKSNMSHEILCLLLTVLVSSLNLALSLTCLQCSNIPQPLHCRTVADCYAGEICGIERIRNNFGETVYNVGCISTSKCEQPNGTRDCTECCSTNLCNVKGCGEQGYPQTRSSICYKCSIFTDSVPCHNIEFCEAGELCMFDEHKDFGVTAYTSDCANVHNCEQGNLATTIIGRDLKNIDIYSGLDSRSVKEHVCHHCCKGDLCNRNCEGSSILKGAHDCSDILKLIPNATTGVYAVTLLGTQREIKVLCDMDTDGGGWTVFQRRVNGSVNFNRSFTEYENGFGNLKGEFWLGLDIIQKMAAQGISEVRLDMVAADGSHAYELFGNFSLEMAPRYTLHLDPGTGTAGDFSGFSYNKNQTFVTYDRNDIDGCAKKSGSGWWFLGCSFVNFNAEYLTPGTNIGDGGFQYYPFKGRYSLRESKMMLRRTLL